LKILILEKSLLWLPRVTKSVKALGHEPATEGYEVVILNLGETGDQSAALTKQYQQVGCVVIAHAGHKETELRELGQAAGCDILATNSELTWKLEKLLEKAGNILETRSVKQTYPKGELRHFASAEPGAPRSFYVKAGLRRFMEKES
jgi:hypothetical protein